jgi:hypothetical protein
MDTSFNSFDFQYFSNPAEMNRRKRKKNPQDILPSDLEFYQKRIFHLTKDLLRGEKITGKVNGVFINYVQVCIEHFKFSDKMELIQKEYLDIEKIPEKTSNFNIETSNDFMLNKSKPHIPKITDNIKIKSTLITTPPIMPKTKIFNLKDPRFRTKGLKKKNLSNS